MLGAKLNHVGNRDPGCKPLSVYLLNSGIHTLDYCSQPTRLGLMKQIRIAENRRTGAPFVHIIAYHIFRTKQLSKLIPDCVSLHHRVQFIKEMLSKF